MAFEDILGLISDESDRKALESIATKYPKIQEGYMRQEDYSSKLAQMEELKGYADQWDTWRQNNWNPELNMTHQQHQALLRAQELEEKLKQSGDPMDFNQIDEYLSKKGLVGKHDVEQLVEAKLPEVTKLVDGRYEALSNVVTKTIPLALKHLKEFDEILDVDAMYANAVQRGITSTDEAYNAYTAEKRAQRDRAAHEKEVEAAFERGKQTATQQLTMGEGGRMPVDLNGPEMGHLQNAMTQVGGQEKANVVPEEVSLGQGVGRFVAQHYRHSEAKGQ